MKNENKEIERLLNSAKNYFGKDEKYTFLNVKNVAS